MSAVLQESAQNPLGGAQAAEDRFQNLYDKGAFEPTTNERPPADPAPEQSTTSPRVAASPAPAQGQVQPEVQAPADEGPEYADLTDYLTKSQIDSESFYKMPVAVTVAGETKKVPLADLLKGYQQEADYTRKTQALAEARRQDEQARAQAQAAIRAQYEQAQTLGNLAHQQLLGEYQQIDWNRLRIEDPSRWAVANQEFNNRAAAIQQHLAQVQQQRQALEQQQQAELHQRILPAEREKLLEARPEWRDDSQFQAARTQMIESARKLGFSDAELQQVYDHRYLIALDLASRYLNLQAQAPAAVKRVRTAPQVAQPGARQARDPQVVARQQAKESFMKNRRDPEAQARYFDTLS
jgi:hypothetical protein